MYGVIYKFVNIINYKIYIGLTTNFSKRIRQHKYRSKNPNKNSIFELALRKYGFDSFNYYIIDWANDQEALNAKEIFWIAFYKSNDKNFGYNIEAGGNGFGRVTEETRKKISQNSARLSGEDNPMFGKHHTEEAKKKISQAMAGENHPCAKLTLKDVKDIRQNKNELTRVELARKYSIYPTGITNILYNKSWKITDSDAYYTNKTIYKRIENLGNTDLSWDNINRIRENKEQLSQKQLSEIYNVAQCSIYNIINNISWVIPQDEFNRKYKENIDLVASKLKLKSPETKEKISKAHKGRVLSQETKDKLSKINKGKIISEETKQKMRDNSSHLSGEDHPMFGRTHSEETKATMSKKHKGENNCRSKLSEEDVHNIRVMYKNRTHTARQIGVMYNIKSSNIRKIVSNRAWKIPEEEFKKYKVDDKHKLNWQKVNEIRLNKDNFSRKQLADKYNVKLSCIDKVINNKSWKIPQEEFDAKYNKPNK